LNKSLPSKNRNALLATGVFFIAFIVFSIIRPSFNSIDSTVNLWTLTIHNSTSTLLASAVSILFDTTSLVAASLVIATFLFIKKQKAQSILLLAGIGGDALLVAIIKNIDQVARPTNQLLPGAGFSYPSGHSAGVIVFVGLVAYYAWLHWRSTRSKVVTLSGFGLIAVVVGFYRIYLNVHWLSDVVGGWLFGIFWLSFSIMIYQRLKAAGKFESDRFDLVANLLFVLGVLVAVSIVLLGWFFNYLNV
jgi:membrane-associated phospholipid phosphatase